MFAWWLCSSWLFFSIYFWKDVEDDLISLTIFGPLLWWGDGGFGSCRLAHKIFWQTWFFISHDVLRFTMPVFTTWKAVFVVKGGEFVEIWVTLWFSSLRLWRFPVTWIWKDVENEYILLVFSCFRYDGEIFSLFHDAWFLDFSGKPEFLSRMNFTDFTAVFFWRGWFSRCLRGAYICDSVLLIVFFNMFPKRCRRWFDISNYFRPSVLVGGWSFWFMPLGSLVFPANLFSCLAWFFTFCIVSILLNGDCFDDLKSYFFPKGASSSRYELRFDFPLCASDVLLWYEYEEMSKIVYSLDVFVFQIWWGLFQFVSWRLAPWFFWQTCVLISHEFYRLERRFVLNGDSFLDVCLVTLFSYLFFSIYFWKDVEDDLISLTIFGLLLWWGDGGFGSCRLYH